MTPDWLSDDIPDPEPEPRRTRRARRRERIGTRADGYRAGTSAGGFLLAAVLVLVLVVGAAWLVPTLRGDSGDAEPEPQQPQETAAPPASQTTGATPSQSPSPSASPSAAPDDSDLEGEALAHAWIKGYLTRPDGRDDPRWKEAIADITTPELLQQLDDEGPDAVGLWNLDHWRVARIKPYKPVETEADTPTRQTFTYTATVTDDSGEKGHTQDRPFILTAYLGDDGRWLIGIAIQPYRSEG